MTRFAALLCILSILATFAEATILRPPLPAPKPLPMVPPCLCDGTCACGCREGGACPCIWIAGQATDELFEQQQGFANREDELARAIGQDVSYGEWPRRTLLDMGWGGMFAERIRADFRRIEWWRQLYLTASCLADPAVVESRDGYGLEFEELTGCKCHSPPEK